MTSQDPVTSGGAEQPDAELWERVRSLFGRALEHGPAEREAWLEQEVAGDLPLLEEVRSLLAHDQGEDERGAVASSPGPLPSRHPRQIGPYRIVSVLGQGGMGTVYEAEQSNPRRRVALKILRVAIANREARRRFVHEGEVLGRLRHPAVAQVYAMGSATVAEGVEVPYLAMEYVQGARTLSDYVRSTSLSLEERLELFCEIADGVEHAHQNGIIHRDLKPANVMIDAEGRPKVIDFGLARAVGEDTDLVSMHTRAGQILGTPTYMSPEQFAGRPHGVGLTTDVYSLGVMLFELVTGRLPHDLQGLSIADMAKIVRDEPPRRLTESSGVRVRDDLDTIVAKALEKDPERRYETAAALVAEVRRYLRKEPILARPASMMHQVLLFARRHRALVGGLAAVLLVSVVAAVVSLRFAFDARRRAEEADRSAYRAQILGAESAIEGKHFAEAADLLAVTPDRMRGWEYRHLSARIDRTLPVPAHADWFLSGIEGSGDATRTVVKRARADGGSEFAVVDVSSGADLLLVPAEKSAEAVPSPDGRELAILHHGPDGKLTAGLWDVSSRRLEFVTPPLDGDEPDAGGLDWHPSSDRFLLSTARGIRIYAAETGALLGSGDRSGGQDSWTADGSWIVALGRGLDRNGHGYGARLLDPVSLELRPGYCPVEGRAHYFPAPSGTLAAIASESGPVYLLDVSDGDLSIVRRLFSNGQPAGACAWSSDGRLCAVGMADGRIRVWEAATGELQVDFASNRQVAASGVEQLAFLPDSGDLLSRSRAGVDLVWPVGTPPQDVLTGHRSYVYPVSVSADGSLLLSGGWDGKEGSPGAVKLWDARTGTLIAEYGRSPERCVYGALTPDGRHAVVGINGGSQTELEVIDLLEGRVRTLPSREGMGFSLHPDGRRLFHAGRIWDLLTGVCLTPGPPDGFDGVISPDGRLLATWDRERKRVHVEELESRAEVCAWSDADEDVAWSSTFSADSRWLISPWGDGTVSIRDARTGALVSRLPDTGAEVITAATSPDGTRIATGGRDDVVRLWDASTFDLVAQLTGHTRYVFDLAWSPDGRALFSSSGDGTVRIWDTRTLAQEVAAKRAREAAMPAIERRVGRALAGADPRHALDALLAADDLDARGRELVAQAAMAFLVPRADAEQHRATQPAAGASADAAVLGGPAWIRAPRAAKPPVIDGRLDDPAWAAAPWTDAFVDIEGPVKPPPAFATRARLLWDDDYLYVAASLEEPQVSGTLTHHDDIVFHDDDFEVFVDPEGDQRWYGEVEVNALGTVFDLQLDRPYREHGHADHGWSPPDLRAAVAVDGTLNDPSDVDRGWTVEIAIPLAALAGHGTTAFPPKAGDVWRVNFSRVEWQYDVKDGRYVKRPDTPEDNWVWSPQYVVDMHRPVQWGFVELVDG